MNFNVPSMYTWEFFTRVHVEIWTSRRSSFSRQGFHVCVCATYARRQMANSAVNRGVSERCSVQRLCTSGAEKTVSLCGDVWNKAKKRNCRGPHERLEDRVGVKPVRSAAFVREWRHKTPVSFCGTHRTERENRAADDSTNNLRIKLVSLFEETHGTERGSRAARRPS